MIDNKINEKQEELKINEGSDVQNTAPKRKNILVVGNGFNIEFLVNGKNYEKIFEKSSNYLRDKALNAGLLKEVHDKSSNKSDKWALYGNTVELKADPNKLEKKYWKYLSTKREWDAETLSSMLLLSRKFQKEDEEFGKGLNASIITDIMDTYNEAKLFNVMWKHEYRKLLLEKLNEYDYIITTNYDNNLTELVRDKSKIVNLTGTFKYKDSIKLTPFISQMEFDSKLIKINKETKRGFIDFDIFGINMTKQLLLLEFIFSKVNRHSKINHYVFNLSKRQWQEDLFQIVKDYSPMEFSEEPIIAERFKILKSAIYSQINYNEWIGRRVKNTLSFAAFPSFEELFKTLKKSK